MNIEEYNKVKDLKYYEYVDYLQNKYGKPNKPYFKIACFVYSEHVG